MSKVVISSLIDKINTLLSRPVGSVSKNASPDMIHQRDQLKQLRSRLENLTDDSLLDNIDQQYQALIISLRDQIGTDKFKTDKLETKPTLLVNSAVSNLFGAEPNSTKETSTMTNGTPDSNSTFVNDRMIAALQQAIQQTLQQVVKESVQQSVQQVVSQTLAVERALMVGEISASLHKIVETQQRSQISQELITLNEQKQKLNAEISKLESDRASWMQQFQEFQTTQQEALDRSLSSVNSYVRDQISDSLQQTVQQTVAVTVADSVSQVNQTVAQTIQDNFSNFASLAPVNIPTTSVEPSTEEFTNKVQEQTDRFLLQLDQMFNSTFRSLEQEIQGYQTAIAAKIGHMESLEQKGEALISTLVDRISQQVDYQSDQQQRNANAEVISPENILPEFPAEIPTRYIETFTEPADENLINALLAGDQFGEAIVIIEPPAAIDIPVSVIDVNLVADATDTIEEPLDEFYGLEAVDNDDLSSNSETLEPEFSELENILGASSDTLFEDVNIENNSANNIETNTDPFDPLSDLVDFAPDIIQDPPTEDQISDQQNAIAAHEWNPDFDVEAATQIIERFGAPLPVKDEEKDEEKDNLSEDLVSLDFLENAIGESRESTENPELLQWLEDIDHRPNPTANIATVSADEDLLTWLGNEALDMKKLPIEEQKSSSSLINPLAEAFNTTQLDDISSLDLNLDAIGDGSSQNIQEPLEKFLYNPINDQANDSDESLILLANQSTDDSGFSEWEDSLVQALNSDLARLNAGTNSNQSIAANLDQFIRNTPYAFMDWDAESSQAYPTIVDISVDTNDLEVYSQSADILQIPTIIDNSNALFSDRQNEQSEIVVDNSQRSPFAEEANGIPEIFDDPDTLFGVKAEDEILDSSASLINDEMDVIFAKVIADNAAKYSQQTPFDNDSELDALFTQTPEPQPTEFSNQEAIPSIDQILDLDDESDLETLLFGSESAHELESGTETSMQQVQIENVYEEVDFGTETMREALLFSEPILSPIEVELDTILQGYIQEESQDFKNNLTKDDRNSRTSDLSADEFFASLESDKLNDFANSLEKASENVSSSDSMPEMPDFGDLENAIEDAEDDLLLNEFADSQGDFHGDSQNKAQGDDVWDDLLNDLDSFNFNKPLLDDRREQLGLSSVAPITDSSENVFDIDSLVLESQSISLIPTPPAKEVYSLDHTWILGIDFGTTALRASLLNADTGRVYSLSLDDADELPCKIVWNDDHSLDDPIAKDIQVITKRSQHTGLENGEVAIAHFKQLFKLGLPYRGVSTWQPIIQWSAPCQMSLRWLIAALKTLLEQIQTRASHPKLPDVGLILLKLSGVVFGYPANWSDTYILNVREAILKAGLVNQAEQVMAVNQSIAPILSLMHEQKIAEEIVVLIDVGAVTTSLCLAKGMNSKEHSKLHNRSLDYAGLNISQDIVVHLFYPHWQLITNPHRHLCNFDHLSLPEIGAVDTEQRILLQQYLLSSQLGQQMLELADRVKVIFGRDVGLDSWNEDLMGQPILVLRRELENLILQPFIQRLNRELNTILSNTGILGEDVSQVMLLGNTMHIPLLSRWITQKLPNAEIEALSTTSLANGLAIAPLYPHLQDVARQQYSDYFLLQEICRLNLTRSVNSNQLLQQLQMRGVNIKPCRDRILSILQGELPDGLFPWQEPESAVVLKDPTLNSELFAGRLFELETDGTYQPNVSKFQELRVYLQAIIGNMSQTLTEPLVFPEITIK